MAKEKILLMKGSTGELEILLEVGGFDVDEDVEMTIIQVHIQPTTCWIKGGR